MAAATTAIYTLSLHDALPICRYGIHVGVAHVDLESRRRSIDSHHRLLDPVRDAADIAGMDRTVARAFPGGILDAPTNEEDETEVHDAEHHRDHEGEHQRELHQALAATGSKALHRALDRFARRLPWSQSGEW